ncbi:MAG: 4-hydroxythreonine-4-phosphate dehydrogenase PdxA [Sedimentisphaerales bacterium]|nr:4-hydroxythreonine-4-phosphate dehydrogenase PdxA [Sedimentisphaerales bacterium]
MDQKRPIIGITMGDPCGIGPEIAVKSVAGILPARAEGGTPSSRSCRPLLIGDASVITEAVALAKLDVKVRTVPTAEASASAPGVIDVLQPEGCCVGERVYGKVSAEAGHAAFVAIEKAIELALTGQIDATVTGPIHKEAINAAGHAFPGHTEIFAQYTGTEDYAMLLVYGDLRVIHVTTHVPLSHISGLISRPRVLKVIELAHEACRGLGIEEPRIGVAGLNPHAGDGGLFGSEEEQHIAPAVQDAQSKGIRAEGPIPPDTLFPEALGGWFDVCVAMYHDQGHIPLKVVGFTWDRANNRWASVNGVNITLGLPIIRTSVDHGTAFDIAGKGIASPDSMIHAIEYAVRLAKAKSQ